MEVIVYNSQGSELERIDLDESVFGVPMNQAVVHQALVRQRANMRVGTASAKTRGEVSGSTRKLYRQKHTGRARAGSLRSPLRRHGGVIFSPKPRDFRQDMPRKMRRLAIRCLLSAKVADKQIRVIDELALEQPKTSQMVQILTALKINRSALIALPSPDIKAVNSAKNIPGVKTIQARQLNVADLLSHENLVITRDAILQVEALWGQHKAVSPAG